jgi:hypothetical protein
MKLGRTDFDAAGRHSIRALMGLYFPGVTWIRKNIETD